MPSALETIRDAQRLDAIVEAAMEIEFWKRQERRRTTQPGRQHAATKRQEWSQRLTELQKCTAH